MGWIIGAPSKRRIKGNLSVTSTAFPTNSAAKVAVKKPLNSTPCSSRIRRLVHKIRLKPTKKKIVGGRTCFTCASHQSKARRKNGAGVEAARAGWSIRYSARTMQSHRLIVLRLTTMPHRLNYAGQRTRKRHEDDQSDDRNNDYHNDHFWVAEALARNHECGGNVALASTERHDPFCVSIRSAEQPTNPKARRDK